MAAIGSAAEPTVGEYTPLVVALRLNGVDLGSILVLRGVRDDNFYFRDSDLSQWGVCHANHPAVPRGGEVFYAFPGSPQRQLTYDLTQQTLDVKLPPDCFEPTRISLARPVSKLTPTAPGLFFNYDFFADGQHTRVQAQDSLTGLFEVVTFNRYGSLLVNALAPDMTHQNAGLNGSAGRALIRLDSAFTRDDADDMTRWEVGDAISGSGIWGRPVRFAGLRYSRNFETHPGFVTQPLPKIEGQADLPSTVEVFLNGVLAARQQVQPGPFQINDLPTFGGGGNVQIVVRDLQGREAISSMPFITGAALLRGGLTDFSIEAGSLREDYGTRSFDYGRGFFSATGRHGLNDAVTLEGRTELQQAQYTSGVGASFIVPGLRYVLTAAIAESQARPGSGHQETFSFQPGSALPVSFSGTLQLNSSHFAQLGDTGLRAPARYIGAASLSFTPVSRLAVSFSQVRSAPRGASSTVVNSLSLSRHFSRFCTVSINAFHTAGGIRNEGLLLTLYAGAGESGSALATANLQRGADGRLQTQYQTEFDHPPGAELGYGWDVRAIRNRSPDSSGGTEGGAGGVYQGRTLTATAQFDKGVDRTDYQIDLSGGFGLLGGRLFASRRIFDSVGVAIAPDLPNLPVYVENQLAGYTDARGRALLPRLIDFSDNKVSVRSVDLPPDAELVGADSVLVAPYHRSGVVFPLPVRRVHGAIVVLKWDGDELIPAGAQVQLTTAAAAADGATFVAERGEVYVSHVVEHDNQLVVQWDHHRCRAEFDVPASERLQPRIGPVPCRTLP